MATDPPVGKRLLTLVHISDMHLAVPTPSQGGAPPRFWRRSTVFDGLLGHTEDALEDLEAFFLRLGREKPRLVVTGDLTACGNPAEFALAKQYLTSRIQLAGGRLTGLEVADALEWTIPGNHDQWPGARVIYGRPTAGLKTLRPTPIAPKPIYLGKGRKLTILGIDSDSDVGPFSEDREFARGQFFPQLDALRLAIPSCHRKEIRVLLVHHSSMHRGEVLSIKSYSNKGLWTFIEQRGVSVMLTGHVHVAARSVTDVTHKDKTWPVLEARCGTTCQTDEVPPGWAAASKTPISRDRFPANSVLLHRLYDTGKAIEWRAHTVPRTDGGFLERNAIPLCDPVVVWPR